MSQRTRTLKKWAVLEDEKGYAWGLFDSEKDATEHVKILMDDKVRSGGYTFKVIPVIVPFVGKGKKQ